MNANDLSKSLAVQPACENCRKRKTRCDRGSPCSPCRAAKLSCWTDTERTKGETRRVQVSKLYETKIDSIDSRLASIERLLQQSHSNQPSPQFHTPATSVSPRTKRRKLDHTTTAATLSLSEDNSNSETPAAGYNDARVEFTAATCILEQAISQDSTLQRDPELVSALTVLRDVVDHDQFGAEPSNKNVDEHGPTEVVTPGWDQVQAVLKRSEGARPMMFNLFSQGMFNNFRGKCQYIYQQDNDASPTDRLLVYSGLACICAEFTSETDDPSASYNHSLQRAFAWLLMDTLASFPLLVPASTEALEALLLAALTMISMCKPSLAWSLIYKAAQMCQKLGYNRLASSSLSLDSQYIRKVLLFWAIYAIDRNISFRLGQTPAIQDFDISTPLVIDIDERHPSARALMSFWVECGRVQGKICTQLYGPAASSMTDEDRARTAQSLAGELERIYQRKQEANAAMMTILDQTEQAAHTDAWVHADGIDYYSTLSTALYAIPPSMPGHMDAIEAARQCLRLSRDLSNRYFRNVYNWTTCCHWVLLKGPLSAFTGVCYNVLAQPSHSREDMQLLEDFVTSLKHAIRFSSPIEKFYRLCLAFLNVTQAYVKAKKLQTTTNGKLASQAGSQALRPIPVSHAESADTLTQIIATDSDKQKAQQHLDLAQGFQEWYTGNASLYGLLEQEFDFSGYDSLAEN